MRGLPKIPIPKISIPKSQFLWEIQHGSERREWTPGNHSPREHSWDGRNSWEAPKAPKFYKNEQKAPPQMGIIPKNPTPKPPQTPKCPKWELSPKTTQTPELFWISQILGIQGEIPRSWGNQILGFQGKIPKFLIPPALPGFRLRFPNSGSVKSWEFRDRFPNSGTIISRNSERDSQILDSGSIPDPSHQSHPILGNSGAFREFWSFQGMPEPPPGPLPTLFPPHFFPIFFQDERRAGPAGGSRPRQLHIP